MDDYKEEIIIELKSKNQVARKVLHSALKSMGYISEDDFYVFERDDDIQPWQSEELLTIDIRCDDKEVYETEEDIEENKGTVWDKLIVSYLMATMPIESIDSLIERIAEIQEKFNLNIVFQDKVLSLESLKKKINRIASELETTIAAPGSEELAILIDEKYSR
jgi:hypothetical protein